MSIKTQFSDAVHKPPSTKATAASVASKGSIKTHNPGLVYQPYAGK
jgi:hypothetical protein